VDLLRKAKKKKKTACFFVIPQSLFEQWCLISLERKNNYFASRLDEIVHVGSIFGLPTNI
jgi:hypothetical protein